MQLRNGKMIGSKNDSSNAIIKEKIQHQSNLIRQYHTNVPKIMLNQIAHLSIILDNTIDILSIITPKNDYIDFMDAIIDQTNYWMKTILKNKHLFLDHACFKQFVRNFAKKNIMCRMKIIEFYSINEIKNLEDTENAEELMKLCR